MNKIKKETILNFVKNINRLFAVKAGLLVILIIIIFLLRGQIGTLSEKTNSNLINLNSQGQLINQAAELQEQYNKYYPALPKIRALLPAQDNLPVFVADVERTARIVGLETITVKFGGEPVISTVAPNVKEISIIINGGGTGTEFADFFVAMGKIPYFININSITIDSQGGLNGTSLLQATGTVFLK